MPTPAFTLTGKIITLSGTADQGYAQITLVNFSNALPRISGTSIIARASYKAQCDNTGAFSVTLWGNDQITPSNTYYEIVLVSGDGAQSANVGYKLTGAGSDLSSLIPYRAN